MILIGKIVIHLMASCHQHNNRRVISQVIIAHIF